MKSDLIDKMINTEIVLREFSISLSISLFLLLISQVPPLNILGGTVYYFLIIYIPFTLIRSINKVLTLINKVMGIILNLLLMSIIMYVFKQTPFFPKYLLDLLLDLFE